MSTALFQGSGVALVTPFTQDGVDFEALDRLIDLQLAGGTCALIVCGTTGEPATMTESEREAVIARAVERAAGRVPVIAGTGCNDTRKTLLAAKRAKALGADAQLCVTPYYNKTTQAGLIAHYTALAEAGSLPVILYNVPSRTGLNMLPETLAALAEHPNIIAMKEASGSLSQAVEMMRLCQGKLAFYSGNDDQVMPLMALGFDGVISVAANIIPREMARLTQACLVGDYDGARQLQLRLNPLISALFCEVSPIPVKTALNLMGCQAGPLRLPLCPMSEAHQAQLIQAMKAWALL